MGSGGIRVIFVVLSNMSNSHKNNTFAKNNVLIQLIFLPIITFRVIILIIIIMSGEFTPIMKHYVKLSVIRRRILN